MSHMAHTYKTDPDCFPRVSGDEPNHRRVLPLTGRFSPRERG